MKFSIITPTYNRPDKLARAVASVVSQFHTDWEMIIVNDSSDNGEYSAFAEKSKDEPRIKYLVNKKNSGVNYSRNRALDAVSASSDYVILLDDDDYLADNALREIRDVLEQNPSIKWLITNRVISGGKSLTKAPRDGGIYQYAPDYLLFRRVSGDATHCISTSLLPDIRFSKNIRQGEEWLFFFSLGQRTRFLYKNIRATLTDGYADLGLNFRHRTKKDQIRNLIIFIKEGRERKLLLSKYFLAYLLLRLVRFFVR